MGLEVLSIFGKWPYTVIWAAMIAICVHHAEGQMQAQLDPALTAAQAHTLAQITAVRDDFVTRAGSSGLACTLPPPRMQVREVPSFGDYDVATNTVATTDWTLLGPDQKALFYQMAGESASEESARATFEDTMHRSMLVHEIAHWWEACHKVATGGRLSLFRQGVQADRIAIAYWREAEVTLPGRIAAIAQGLIDHSPSPVPAGQQMQEYFNQNYEKLDPSAQPWFGAQFYLAAYRETPPPTLSRALALTTK